MTRKPRKLSEWRKKKLPEKRTEKKIDPVYDHVRKIIFEMRQRQGLTQAELAKAANLSRATIANIERGAQQTPLHTLKRIADALCLRAIDFMPNDWHR